MPCQTATCGVRENTALGETTWNKIDSGSFSGGESDGAGFMRASLGQEGRKNLLKMKSTTLILRVALVAAGTALLIAQSYPCYSINPHFYYSQCVPKLSSDCYACGWFCEVTYCNTSYWVEAFNSQGCTRHSPMYCSAGEAAAWCTDDTCPGPGHGCSTVHFSTGGTGSYHTDFCSTHDDVCVGVDQFNNECVSCSYP